MNRVSFVICVATSLAVSACSSITIHRIDPNTHELDTKAPEGVRYYLPRPYVSVTEPFVIGSRTYIAEGQLSPDSNYVLITKADPKLAQLAPLIGATKSMGVLSIASGTVSSVDAPAASDLQAQGAPASSTSTTSTTTNGNGSGKGGGTGDTKGGSDQTKSEPKSGTTNNKVTNDTTAILVTPQARYFNIVWLPDFDEQYVITTHRGFGKASATISLGQGWYLQGLDATVDNSALTQPLLDFYSGTRGALQKLATSKIAPPISAIAGGSAQGAAAPQSQTAAKFSGGTPVTVKVTIARIVAPGLYPILKPKEVEKADSLAKLNQLGTTPEEETNSIWLPEPPLTNIAFNTYETFVIEAARATGDNAFHALQNSETTNGATKITSTGQGGGTTTPPTDAVKKLNDVLKSSAYMTKGGDYYVATLAQANGKPTIILKKATGGSGGTLDSLPPNATIKTFVSKTMGQNGAPVDEANVTISP